MTDILSGHLASAAGAGGNGDDENNRRKELKKTCEGDPPLGSGLSKPKSRKRPSDAEDGTPSCTLCGKVFWSNKALYGHMRLHPDRPWRGMNPPAMRKEIKEVAASLMLLSGEDESPLFQCKSCKKTFTSRHALGGHRASHKNVKGCCALDREKEERIAAAAAAAADLVNQWAPVGESSAKKRKAKTKKPVLDLDLNFPAPDEENDGGDNDEQK
ncbi:hypothetical protein J5N97_023667 [Dioscorea zingiberensis]|uniref:C2H2-type domain-containing protein n=1 Tax=Dioscorea zingiberensis TaxID=325984 RepID=A0A9D5H840_9LILI|nr:hypothetical protein J5N97_023667 [Dioscorea zingiberensis]